MILRVARLGVHILFVIFLCRGLSLGKTIVLEGRLDSSIRVTQQINFSVDRNLSKLSFRLALPGDFSNKAVNQTVRGLDISYTPQPTQVIDEVDRFGNRYKTVVWGGLNRDASIRVTFDAGIKTNLSPMESKAPFPLYQVPQTEGTYLGTTQFVQSDNPEIKSLAKELTKGASSQYEAVTSIINFVADNVKYTYNPPEYDALYTLRSKSGNCTNFAHLSLALLRASGIPARFVAGISLNKQWRIPLDDYQSLVQTMGQGKHAWIEVFFPDLGWLSYDPAQSKHFTSTRHIKEAHGLDYRDIVGSWTGTPYAPKYSNSIEAQYLDDTIDLKSKYSYEIPRAYLYSNQILAKAELPRPEPVKIPEPRLFEPKLPEPQLPQPVDVKPRPTDVKPKPVEPEPPKPVYVKPRPVEPPKPVVIEPPKPAPPKPSPAKPEPKPAMTKPKPTPSHVIQFGNIDFPSLVNAYNITGNTGREMLDAETAEYVTSEYVYAQAFRVDKPLLVNTISLAMHKFGGDGTMFIDLVKDENGRPSLSGIRSLPLFLDKVEKKQGYYWVDFRFPEDVAGRDLNKGKYWIVLRRSGEAIMTWFFTPGKSYGDPDDARSTLKGYRWEDILNYDFVFKVKGESLL